MREAPWRVGIGTGRGRGDAVIAGNRGLWLGNRRMAAMRNRIGIGAVFAGNRADGTIETVIVS